MSWIHSFVRYAESRGVHRAQLLAAASLSEGELNDPAAQVAEHMEIALWQCAQGALADPLVGIHFGRSVVSAGAFGLVGYLGRASPTWGDCLESMVRYHPLLGMHQADLERTAETVTLSFDMTPAMHAARQPGEALLVGALTAFHNAVGRKDAPLELRLPHPAPVNAEAYGAALGVRVTFGAQRYSIVWTRAQAELRHLAADPQTHRYFERAAERAMRRSGPRHLRQAVCEEVMKELDRGAPTLRAVAKRMAISPRTLQRRLHESGFSYSAIIDEARRVRAMSLIESSPLSISEIAYSVGFHDPSAFRRAFQRWVGHSPIEERRLRRATPAAPSMATVSQAA